MKKCKTCNESLPDDGPDYAGNCPGCHDETQEAMALREDEFESSLGGVLGADGQVYSDADPGM